MPLAGVCKIVHVLNKFVFIYILLREAGIMIGHSASIVSISHKFKICFHKTVHVFVIPG